MRDDPKKISDNLINDHGLKKALSVATNGKVEASRTGDYYSVSVWRKVTIILQSRADGADDNSG